jgi:hypothetical protein
MAYKGKFKPKNPKKYQGDPSGIVYRSSLELRFMMFCDSNPAVLAWASEELIIPYKSPIDGKVHRYFPDFWIMTRKRNGEITESVIEVKPKKQCSPPDPAKRLTKTGRKSRRYIHDVKAWGINSAKWEAARALCEGKGWEFVILDEGHLKS